MNLKTSPKRSIFSVIFPTFRGAEKLTSNFVTLASIVPARMAGPCMRRRMRLKFGADFLYFKRKISGPLAFVSV